MQIEVSEIFVPIGSLENILRQNTPLRTPPSAFPVSSVTQLFEDALHDVILTRLDAICMKLNIIGDGIGE